MLSDDLHHQHLMQLSASIKAWSGFVADVARVEIGEDAGAWRFAITPDADSACPIEIVCHEKEQVCELSIGAETYDGWRPARLDMVLDVLKAVTDGAVVTRHFSSSATGADRGTTTEVILPGQVLKLPISSDEAAKATEDGVVCRALHYLPYRKVAARL